MYCIPLLLPNNHVRTENQMILTSASNENCPLVSPFLHPSPDSREKGHYTVYTGSYMLAPQQCMHYMQYTLHHNKQRCMAYDYKDDLSFDFIYIPLSECRKYHNYYYYYYVIRTLGTTTDKIDRRTDRHTENKHKTTH